MNKYFTLLIGAAVAVAANAAPRTQQQAMALAAEKAMLQGATLQVSHSKMVTAMPKHVTDSQMAQPYYTFNKAEGGFIIVSGDDRMPAIVGYTDSGTFDPDQLPDGLKYYLDQYAAAVANAASDNAAAEDEEVVEFPYVEQLLGQTEWDQKNPYHNMCPVYSETDSKTGEVSVDTCMTGCAATAAAQIMYYHKYAVQMATIPAYTTQSLGIKVPAIPMGDDAANLFDWNNMLPQYKDVEATQEQQDAVAKLMLYVGCAQEMDYAPSVSGSVTEGVFKSFLYLGYDPSLLQIAERRDFTKSGWLKMLNNELLHHRPVEYVGTAGSMGHAFVLDGCDGEGYYHINWGWSGSSNGYFDIAILDPHNTSGSGASSANTGYNANNAIVLGITPENVDGEQQQEPDFAELPDYSNVAVEFGMADGTSDFYYNPNYAYVNQMVMSVANNTEREICDMIWVAPVALVNNDTIPLGQTVVPYDLKKGESVVQIFDAPGVKEYVDLAILFAYSDFTDIGGKKVDMKLLETPNLELSLETNATDVFVGDDHDGGYLVNDSVVTVDFKVVNTGGRYRGNDFAMGIGKEAGFSLMEIPEGETHYILSQRIEPGETISFIFGTTNVNLPTTSEYQVDVNHRCYFPFYGGNGDITGIQQLGTQQCPTVEKRLVDGRLVIAKDGQLYDVTGIR